MQTLQSYFKKSDVYKSFEGGLNSPLYVEGLDGFPLFLCARILADKCKGRLWLVCPTEETARQLFVNNELALGYCSEKNSVYLPCSQRGIYDSWKDDTKDYEQLRALGEIANSSKGLIVTNIRAMCLSLPNKTNIENGSVRLKVNDNIDTMKIASSLGKGGYFRTENTTLPGEFTIRGEVIDIFPYGSTQPVRIYLDWDRVDRICRYEPITQKIGATLGHIELQIISNNEQQGLVNKGIKDYFSDEDCFVFVGDQRLESSYRSLCLEAKAAYRTAYQADNDAVHPADVLFDFEEFYQNLTKKIVIRDIANQIPAATRFSIEGPRSYFGNFTFLKEELKGLEHEHWNINIYTNSQIQKERLELMLDEFPSVKFHTAEISGGFSLSDQKFIVMNESEIFGRKKQVIKTLQHTQTSVLDNFIELHEGDYVVHVNYGIGLFLKIDRVRERDYIKIQYADKEVMFVPIEQANLVQRYIGSAGEAPRLDKLGTSSWENKKAKARKSAEELAQQLINLYARRKNSHGFAFDRDNDWQLRFEASFEYEETEDQLTCIRDIKDDMESPHVMDRLICGDVGFGKTEIAFRAVFKAVLSGKQVAFLAPTTILAEQHYRNFLQRLGEFPVSCGLLSRMITPKKQKGVIEKVKNGQIDVLFGTHRIIQSDISFSDLGLLVIDEEQRFGVKDKEKIKQMKANIDCLSLSATPIPRTLYMSLLKIRDMSLLTTPPVQRKEIMTFVEPYDLDKVCEAIKKEVRRHGQVYYLHNRIESLEAVADVLRSKMPEVIIETAHGQMQPAALEDTMRRFLYEGIQVLVSTTIIENGIDIPNVNTIIIDRADMYGVSQLYQLKGRVGRSDREAYAYLFYPSQHILKDEAIKRLQIISEHTELGSGFKIAMKDMELRGAGNILGKEQSGFLSVVGLDMYIRLLDEAIAQIQNTGEKLDQEVFLDLDYSGFIPDTYISDSALKFEYYKKISSIKNQQQLEQLTAQLKDRFGSIPEEVSNLLYICELKIVCRKLDIYHMKERKGEVSIEFSKVSSIDVNRMIDMIKTGNGAVRIDPRRPNFMTMKTDAISLRDKALFILEKLQRLIP